MLRLLSLSLFAAVATGAFASDHLQVISDWRDIQLYVKPKYNLISSWDQEFGIQGTLLKYGRFRESFNFTYDPTYQIRFDQKPHLSLGLQTTYLLDTHRYQPGVYTKIKNNLINQWKQETGLTAHLFSWKHNFCSANVAYLWTYPYANHSKPQWLALVAFAFPLR